MPKFDVLKAASCQTKYLLLQSAYSVLATGRSARNDDECKWVHGSCVIIIADVAANTNGATISILEV